MTKDQKMYDVRDYGNQLTPGKKIEIERSIYTTDNMDISNLAALSLEKLETMREESAATEQTIFENLQEAAKAWDTKAAQTLLLDKAIEYAKTPPVKHTANKWVKGDYDWHEISNRVYKMYYRISEDSKYDSKQQKSIPYAWDVTWSVYTNSPTKQYSNNNRIAGQDRKRYTDKTDMEKYLNGRIKAYSYLFTEISPPIPKEYKKTFTVNGHLLPGYTVEGEKPKQLKNAADINVGGVSDLKQNLKEGKEQHMMSEKLSIQLSKENNLAEGVWLKLPTTTEQFQNALNRIGVMGGEYNKDFFITGFESSIDAAQRLSLENLQNAKIDEINYLAAQLEALEPEEIDTLNVASELVGYWDDVNQLAEYVNNTEFFEYIPDVLDNAQLGEYYLKNSGEIQIPKELLSAVDVEKLGELIAANEMSHFTDRGYIREVGDEWKPVDEVPQEYQITPKSNSEYEMAMTMPSEQIQTPVVNAEPFVLVADNPKEKLAEITGKLEAGVKGIFESEQYKKCLDTFAKFHNYSVNNCLLISMQKPDATHVAGFNAWKDNFNRQVQKGEKGIKIIAPSPFKVKKEVDKRDEKGNFIIENGQRVKEEKEITIPAFKVATVFDVSQTDGEPLPQLGVSELIGSVDKYKDFFAALEKTSSVPIGFEKMKPGAKGYYHQTEKRIAINEGMSELQNLKTAIHEIAHSRLHAIDTQKPLKGQDIANRHTREIEAESIAYTVCQHYGIDTSDYSFGYIAGWSGDKELDTLKSSLETIRQEADGIITEVNKHFAELEKSKEQIAEKTTETINLNVTPITSKAPVQGGNMAAIEAKAKAGQVINLTEISDAMAKDKQAAQARQPNKAGISKDTAGSKTKENGAFKPKQESISIREQLAVGKKQLETQKAKAPRNTSKSNTLEV